MPRSANLPRRLFVHTPFAYLLGLADPKGLLMCIPLSPSEAKGYEQGVCASTRKKHFADEHGTQTTHSFLAESSFGGPPFGVRDGP